LEIRIATRKSALALWQAEHVAALLLALPEVAAVDLVPLSTRGDEILDRSLQKIGGKGLFIKELEVAIRSGAADVAVHSMKDVPAEMPEGFCIAALLERANHADAFVSGNGGSFAALPDGALIGSSSLRRQAQLKLMRPDLRVEPLRATSTRALPGSRRATSTRSSWRRPASSAWACNITSASSSRRKKCCRLPHRASSA